MGSVILPGFQENIWSMRSRIDVAVAIDTAKC